MNKLQTVRFWLDNARKVALPQSMMPALVAFVVSLKQADEFWWLGILGILGVAVGHLGLNLFDDYFDYKRNDSSFRDRMASAGFRARIAKCEYITSGKATVRQLLVASCVFSALALVIGAVIFWFRGVNILYIALATALLGISYSGAPLRLSYHGLGELVIGVIFGPLVMCGVAIATMGVWSWSMLFLAVPIGILVINIVYTHAVLDYAPDKSIGKRTMAVAVDRRWAKLFLSFLCNLLPFAIIIIGVVWGYLPLSTLLVFVVLPMAVALYRSLEQFCNDPQSEVKRSWWMGPMENFEVISERGLSWFMIRWYTSRNLITFFCFLLVLGYWVG